jgi:hypothetical protein
MAQEPSSPRARPRTRRSSARAATGGDLEHIAFEQGGKFWNWLDPQSPEQTVLASDDAGKTWAPLAKPTA